MVTLALLQKIWSYSLLHGVHIRYCDPRNHWNNSSYYNS